MNPIVVIIVRRNHYRATRRVSAFGWYFGSKPTKAAAETADTLRITLDGVRDERDAANTELAGLQADARNHDKATGAA